MNFFFFSFLKYNFWRCLCEQISQVSWYNSSPYFTYILLFTNSAPVMPSLWPDHFSQSLFFHPFHHSTLSINTGAHTILLAYVSWLSPLPSCHSTCLTQIIQLPTTHSCTSISFLSKNYHHIFPCVHLHLPSHAHTLKLILHSEVPFLSASNIVICE